ncbi:hypothetical protein C2H86_13860 [Pseudomonas putida]|uniref:RING-type E3 ubiquitin transferase n=1 Tax=Pseudomonas putida TaxID=303 RepID=A0A6I6Y3F2_PSEPU|nr:hypothetical protein C2H86_13860 [Pseudomonas putida]
MVRSLRKDYLDENGVPYSWYAAASPDDQALLRRLIGYRENQLKALQGALKGFQDIRTFCKPLLKEQLNLDVEVDKAQYVQQPYEIFTPWMNPPGLEFELAPPVELEPTSTRPKGPAQKRSLLEAALHNFEGLDEVGPYDTLVLGPQNDAALPRLQPLAFVRQCRALDLGQKYQNHLQAIYEGPRRVEIERFWGQAQRQVLKVQVMIAWLKGLLTKAGREALVGLCNNESQPYYNDRPLRCWRFSLFGIPIHDVLLMGSDIPGQATPCVLYIPNDSEHPIREFNSLQDVGAHLRRRLLQTEFRRRLVNNAYKSSQVELSHKLEAALFETTDTGGRKPRKLPHIPIVPTPLALPIWHVLFNDHKLRLLADAKAIAVPTADANAAARQKRLQHWLDSGMNLLNVAAFFVPGLDVVMSGVFAYQIMDSVFTGFEAWEEGDTQEALGQLESLAVNAAVIAGFAAGTYALKASGFVDALESVWKDGREQLWKPDMRSYASNAALPADAQADAWGLYSVNGKRHVLLEGQLYEAFENTDRQWCVRHPASTDAYAPPLRYLGDKRWQLTHDDPLGWNDEKLLHALGTFSQGLQTVEQLAALRIAGDSADVLRYHQVNGSRPPALLTDILLRLQLDNDATDIINRVRHGLPLAAYKNLALPELVSLPDWPARYRLKVFTGAEKWGDAAYYGAPDAGDTVQIEIGREDLEQGHLSMVVLAAMDEDAIEQLLPGIAPEQRARALDEQLASRLTTRRVDVFERLLGSRRTPLSIEAQTISRQFPGVPDSALQALVEQASHSERQRLAGGRVPLRVAEEARHLQARTRLDRAVLGLYRTSLANSDSQKLRQALLAKHPHANDAQLLDFAVADRSGCATLLGQQPIKPGWRSPLRLAHGRIGYPLSGRGSVGAAEHRLRSLFPSLNASQISDLRAELSKTGDLGAAVKELQAELQTLDRDLKNWIWGATDVFERQDRQRCASLLEEAWRREGASDRETLVLERMRIPRMPAVTARLPHIRELKLTGLELQQLDAQFLSCFPNLQVLEVTRNPAIDAQGLFDALASVPRLRSLDLTSNGLASLTPAAQNALTAMPDLRQLNLRRNQLTLDETTLTFLASRPLDILRLGSNRITLDENLAKRFQDLVHPQRLDLSFNPLQRAPDVRYMARLQHLDLNNCALPAWPEGLTTLMSQPQYQLRFLDLSSNRIHHIADLSNILRSPYARDVSAHLSERRWLFNYNGLEAETRRRLLASGVNVFEHPPERPEWQGFWRDWANTQQEQLWTELFEQSENGDLQAVLERLVNSKEAQRDPQGLRERVWALLERARENSALRERLNEVAQLYPPTCGDAGAEAFSALEVELLASDAFDQAHGTAKPLLDLYRQLYRREKVNELADRISFRRGQRKQALLDNVMDEELPAYDPLDVPTAFPDVDLETGLVDDIEVRLALRQSLAHTLDFPEPSSGMLYRDAARINRQIIGNVEAAVRTFDADTDARQQWTCQQPVWINYLKVRYASQFEAITDFWRPGLDYLFYCWDADYEPITHLDSAITRALAPVMPAPPLDEHGALRRVPLGQQAFDNATSALTHEQQQVEAGLLLSLTRQLEVIDA